jgi:hypothetical protein
MGVADLVSSGAWTIALKEGKNPRRLGRVCQE